MIKFTVQEQPELDVIIGLPRKLSDLDEYENSHKCQAHIKMHEQNKIFENVWSTSYEEFSNESNFSTSPRESRDLKDLMDLKRNFDLQFQIKYIDTGEVVDVREERTVEINQEFHCLDKEQFDPKILGEVPKWKEFKKRVKANNNRLWDWTESGKMKEVEALLSNPDEPVEINAKTLDDYTALHFAANEGFDQLCQLLINKGSEVDAKTKMKRTPMHLASLRGYSQVIEVLSKNKASLNVQDEEGSTPLHLASEQGRVSAVRTLLQLRADTGPRNRVGMTALEMAANVSTRDCFKSMGITLGNESSYSRVAVGASMLGSSRVDHVSKLIFMSQQNKKLEEMKQKQEELKSPTKVIKPEINTVTIENFRKNEGSVRPF